MSHVDETATNSEYSFAAVAEIMTRPVVVIDSGASLSQALERLVASGLRHLVVIPPGAGRCVGVLADRHLAAFWPLEPHVLQRRTVAEALPDRQPYVRTTERVDRAAELMLESGADAIPVLDQNDDVVGIVTVSDILNAVAIRSLVRRSSDVTQPGGC